MSEIKLEHVPSTSVQPALRNHKIVQEVLKGDAIPSNVAKYLINQYTIERLSFEYGERSEMVVEVDGKHYLLYYIPHGPASYKDSKFPEQPKVEVERTTKTQLVTEWEVKK